MTGAIIFYSSNKQTRLNAMTKYINDNLEPDLAKINPDIYIADCKSGKHTIGIEEIRSLNKFINQKPILYSSRLAIVYNAHTLTLPAQNALLKTLEETPSYATIILETKTLKSLLDTVVSRCRRIKVGESSIKEDNNSFEALINENTLDAMAMANELSKEDKEKIIQTLEDYITGAREYLLQNPRKEIVTSIDLLIETKESIENTNVSVRLALERLFLNIAGLGYN